MKKFLIIVLLILCVTGCQKAENNIETEGGYDKDFGSYEVPTDWVESKKYSSSNKFFYVLKGEEDEPQPNNISINRGTNRYAEEDHETFRKSILAQLSFQTSGIENKEITGSGSTTDNGYVLYTFVINEKDENVITTQYYIVGNYEYILVHETSFGESKETDDAAKFIVNSFKWKTS